MISKKGYIHVYTGNGKGKTTAAMGLSLRAAGAGYKVWIGQFLKKNECSEHKAFKRFDDLITIRVFGQKYQIGKTPDNEDIQQARGGLKEASEIIKKGEYNVVVLDEATIAVWLNMFTVNELIDVLKLKHEETELIITGRDAPKEIVEIADLVTEMREIKHYYSKGVSARTGIEK